MAGWSEARFEQGPLGVLFFYATNLGFPFALAIVAAFTARGLATRRFLVAWMVALFVIPNVVRVSAVDFDMNKYFQIMWIAVAILAAWLIRRWPRIAIAAVLVGLGDLPALIVVWHLLDPAVTMSLPRSAAGRWIEANTPERSVFITDAYINSPVDLAGRLRITTFGPYVANLGYDPDPREADVHGDLLRRPGRRGRHHGEVRRHVRALERRRARVRRRDSHRLRVERPLRGGLRPGRGVRLAAARAVTTRARRARATSPSARR